MKNVLMNMVRIFDGDQVLVLDKVKKYGWEGLTFPGGKVEPGEAFYDSAIREAKEETNLDVRNLEFNGIIQWIDNNERFVGYLYTCRDFEGQLIPDHEEGKLFFKNYKEFLNMPGKSDSMDTILKIYEGEYFEIVLYYEDGKLVREECRK